MMIISKYDMNVVKDNVSKTSIIRISLSDGCLKGYHDE